LKNPFNIVIELNNFHKSTKVWFKNGYFRYNFKVFSPYLSADRQVRAKSFLTVTTIFCSIKKAITGSSFFSIQKKGKLKNLQWIAGHEQSELTK